MKKYIGIDLHSNNSVVVVSDEEDRVIFQKRMANDLNQIERALAPHRDGLVGVVVESTYNWYWLVDGLMSAGYRVHLANAATIKKYEGLKYSGDEADAAYLAQLLRLKLLPEGYIYPREERPVRDLARKRAHLVRCRTTQILAIENTVSRQTAVRLSSRQVKSLNEEAVGTLNLPVDVALTVNAHRAVIAALTGQIEAIEQRLHERVAPRREFRLLKTVPGIGEVLGPCPSCSKPGRSRALPRSATSAPIAAVSPATTRATRKRRGRETARTAINTSPGRSWRPRTLRLVSAPRPSASTSASAANAITSLRPRHSRINSRAPVITC